MTFNNNNDDDAKLFGNKFNHAFIKIKSLSNHIFRPTKELKNKNQELSNLWINS